MPIYEYQCDDCNHRFDALQKVSDEPLKDCPECGALSLRKLISAPNFRLKGGGWYETDFKTANRKNLADDGKKPADKGTGTDKPAAADAKKDSATAKPATDGKGTTKSSSGAASKAD